MDHGQDDQGLRRRRKITRSMREKTPEPTLGFRQKHSTDDESSSTAAALADAESMDSSSVHTERLQIRTPGIMSAHESKILRRRDKIFATAAARSHSQPRQAERLSSPEAYNLLNSVKRSLSSPRHKDESSEGEPRCSSPPFAGGENQPDSHRSHYIGSPPWNTTDHAQPAPENLSRHDQNLRRFENERKRFETEKRQFEKEKREHKLRCKQFIDNEERRRLLQSYRKLSEKIQLPANEEERRRMVNSLRLSRNEVPVRLKSSERKPRPVYESSTPISSSESEPVYANFEDMASRSLRKFSPQKSDSGTNENKVIPTLSSPPPVPERKIISRNNSLSPIRPQSRSRTPEQRLDLTRKLSSSEVQDVITAPLKTPETEMGEKVIIRRRNTFVNEVEKPERVPLLPLFPTESIETIVVTPVIGRSSIISNMFSLFKRNKEEPLLTQPLKDSTTLEPVSFDTQHTLPEKILSKVFIKKVLSEMRTEWRKLKADYPVQLDEMRRMRNKCTAHIIVLILLCGFGGLMFRYTEGSFENIYKCEVRKVRRDFIDYLWTVSHNMREDDWKSAARNKLRKFEEELTALQDLGLRRFPGMKSWNFVNCILYCWTVVTTIGYGHITPQTTMGRSLTIIYAIIGIPIFLILLADFGKVFTRGMKFLWAYVRRLYYIGSCRQVRKQQQVRDVVSGFNTVYDMAIRRPSMFFGGGSADVESQSTVEAIDKAPQTPQSLGTHTSRPATPTSPYPETFEVNDEFNLPVSVATALLVSYILFGAFVYTLWEDWTYFEAFYFVFISMSTIGFGDLVPNHPIFMMCSIIYLIFGLALTSMFINVVQIKLSDTFKQASAKIGATIGLEFGGDGGGEDADGSQVKTPSDIATVHNPLGLDLKHEVSKEEPSSVLARTLRTAANETNGSTNENNDLEIPPTLLPRRQVSTETPQTESEPKKKSKKKFFK